MSLMVTVMASPGALAASPGASPTVPTVGPSAAPFTAATIAAPGSDPLGVSYGDWASRWWTWLLGFPADTSPALVDSCDAGQGTDVVFIPQTFLDMNVQTTCHVAAGQSVLVSPAGSLTTADPGDTDADIIASTAAALESLTNIRLTVDGQDVPGLDAYLVAGDPFELPLVADNLFGAPEGTARAVGGGWFVMLSDLAPGTHTIVVHDESQDPEAGLQAAELTATVEVAPAE